MFCLLLSRIARLGSPAMKDLHFGSLRRHSQSAHSNIGVPQPIRNSALGLFASGRDHCLLHKGVCCSHLKCSAHAFFSGRIGCFRLFVARAELTGLAESITFSGGYAPDATHGKDLKKTKTIWHLLAFGLARMPSCGSSV